ncbi:MAG TPA: DUF3300 domain-containing protein [Stellaceae bacterium]|nr:DUF3300 domain-containing protein [Stellaceae bacterium]
MTHLGYRASVAALPLLLALSPVALAQMPQPPSAAEAQAALNQAPAQFTKSQLDQMVAPIALYPDQLLTQMLMAATFPDQLVDANKWLQDGSNASLKGDDLANALQPLPWDPSVKSLVAFPQLVAMMIDHLDWTQALGAAFANQQVEVFARVQFLRDRAKAAGKLSSTKQLAVREEGTDIIIEPADPNEIYVPVYNPAEVYGTWPDSDAPPVYIPPPRGFYNGAIGAGIGFSVGYGVVAPLWGWGHPDWRRHQVDIDRSRYEHITTQTNITRNHIIIEGGAWHRSGPIAQVPEAERPHPQQPAGEQPKGTVRPSEIVRQPGAPEHQHGGPPNANEPTPHPGQPGRQIEGPTPRPGEQGHPEEHGGPPGAQPGPHPAGQAPHPEEHAAPLGPRNGPHPAGEAQPAHPEERGAQPAPHPAGQPPHPEEHAAPPGAQTGPHPAGQAPHPEEHVAPPGAQTGPHPAGQAPHPEERAAPPHPEGHAAPPHPEEHAAPPPHPEAGPQHPAPAPQAHPAPQQQQQHAAPQKPAPKPGEEKKPEDQQQH